MGTLLQEVSKFNPLHAALEVEKDINLNDLKTKTPVAEEVDIAKIKEIAKRNSETVFGSAADYFKNCIALDQLATIFLDDLHLAGREEELRMRVSEKKRIDDLLQKVKQPIRDQFSVDLLLVIIDSTNPKKDSEVVQFLDLVLQGGQVCPEWNPFLKIGQRARPASQEEIKSAINGDNKVKRQMIYLRSEDGKRYNLMHIPSKLPGREGEISGADKRIFGSLRNLLYRFRTHTEQDLAEKRQKEEKKILSLKLMKSDHHPRYIADGIPGTYVLALPPRKEKAEDGVCVVEVYSIKAKERQEKYFIKIIDGVGSMRIFGANSGKYFPLWWYQKFLRDKDIPASVPDDMYDWVLACCRKIYHAVAAQIAKDSE